MGPAGLEPATARLHPAIAPVNPLGVQLPLMTREEARLSVRLTTDELAQWSERPAHTGLRMLSSIQVYGPLCSSAKELPRHAVRAASERI